MIGRRAQTVRIAWLGALVFCAAASFAHAEPVKDTAPPESVDPQRLHRIEALVELSEFPKIYDATMQGIAALASADERSQLMQHVMGMVVWSRSRDGFLPLMARTISDDVLDRAEAFYAGEAGHALVACIRQAQGIESIKACASAPGVGGGDARLYAEGEFLRPQNNDAAVEKVMSQSFCGALADDRPTLERFAALCAREASSRVCAALVHGDDGTTLDADRCLHDLSGP